MCNKDPSLESKWRHNGYIVATRTIPKWKIYSHYIVCNDGISISRYNYMCHM